MPPSFDDAWGGVVVSMKPSTVIIRIFLTETADEPLRATVGEIFSILLSVTVSSVAGFLSTLIIAFYRRDQAKYSGRWNAGISWEKQGANKRFGQTAEQPLSSGRLLLARGFGRKKFQKVGFESLGAKRSHQPDCSKHGADKRSQRDWIRY